MFGARLAERGRELTRSALRVRGAQLQRELLQRGDAAFLGLAAPRLQVGDELLGRDVGAGPELAQLLAHRDQLGEHRAVLDRAARPAPSPRSGSCRSSRCSQRLREPQVGELRAVGDAFALEALRPRRALARRRLARVLGHHLVAVGDDRLERLVVGDRLDRAELQHRRRLADLGQAEHLEAADVDPADVELVRLDRQLGRRRVGVVVVVQLFAADDRGPTARCWCSRRAPRNCGSPTSGRCR